MYEVNGMEFPRYKEHMESIYASTLAPYAVKRAGVNSRLISEDKKDEKENRSDFQRDRDRIIHSKAFRRLMYKTQVFVNHEGDHFRTRLTHTLEVAQFARGICKSMGLNDELAEAIALGHDLGHTPFGHAVEGLLSERCDSGFLHNEHSVRVVDILERRRENAIGLNLTREVREGILKHNKDSTGLYSSLNAGKPCSFLEGQVVALVDTVAYICHDLQDGIYSGLIENACCQNEDYKISFETLAQKISEILGEQITIHNFYRYDNAYFIRELIHKLIVSITEQSVSNLADKKITTVQQVAKMADSGETLVCMEEKPYKLFKDIKNLVYENVYGLYTIKTMDAKAVEVAKCLLETFLDTPQLLPPDEYYKINNLDKLGMYENRPFTEKDVIVDYIASMTDRFALEEHERIRNPRIRI